MSPWRHSLTSRIKKSTLGPPMPIHTIDTGVPRYRPVMVRNPRSECNENGLGNASKFAAICLARESEPTVTLFQEKTWSVEDTLRAGDVECGTSRSYLSPRQILSRDGIPVHPQSLGSLVIRTVSGR